MQDCKYLPVAVVICTALVNTHTHTHSTAFTSDTINSAS